MVRRILVLLACIGLMPAMGFGQTADPIGQETGVRTGTSRFHLSDQASPRGFRLFDPSKLSMSQQYTMLFGVGGNTRSARGLYVNTLQYRFAPNAQMTVHLGYLHQLSSPFNGRSGSDQNRLLPGFELLYRPTSKVLIQINYGPYGSRYGYGFARPYDPRWRVRSRTSSPDPLDLWDEER